MLNKDEVIRILREHKAELQEMGIAQLSLFGSVARNEQTETSDIDLAATFNRTKKKVTAFDFIDIENHINRLLNCSVDLVSLPTRKARMQLSINKDKIDAF